MALNLHYSSCMRRGLEKTKKEIRSLYSRAKIKPTNTSMEHPKLYSRARRYFGTWKNALEVCGIDYYEARNYTKWTRKKIMQKIVELHCDGHSLRPSDLKRNVDIKLISAASYHFGSWSKAVQSSGILYSYGRRK